MKITNYKFKKACPAKLDQREMRSGGFTLVEIIVALGIFVTTVTIAIGSLVGLYSANNKSQALSSVINDLNYSIENMTRTIRFATVFHCCSSGTLTSPQSCNNGDTFFAVSTSSTPTIYRLQNNKLEQSTNSGASYDPITSSEVTIQYARFYVFNTTKGDSNQPYAILVLKGFAGDKPGEQSVFDIQTKISQRELDI